MKITLGKWIYGGSKRFSGEEPLSIMELDGDPYVRPLEPVLYDIAVQWTGGELIVRGRLTTRVSMCCARCGAWFESRVTAPDFSRVLEVGGEGGIVDLTDDIREDMLLALPFVALCSENCKGVCLKCGTNKNIASCECGKEKPLEWSAFEKLKI